MARRRPGVTSPPGELCGDRFFISYNRADVAWTKWIELTVLGVLLAVAGLRHKRLPVRVEDGALVTDPVTILCVCNTRYTAGAMMMAPAAAVDDGLADLIPVGPLGRLDVIRTFPKIYSGTHLEHPAVTARATPRIDFTIDKPVDVMVDGEALHLMPRSIEVLPRALEVNA